MVWQGNGVKKNNRRKMCVRANQGKNVGSYILPLTKCLDFPFRVVRYEKLPTENYAGCRKNKNRSWKGRPERCRSNAPLLPLDLLYIRFLCRGVTLKSLVIED